MKYLLITLQVREGERVHTHRCLETTNAKNIYFAAERFASKYWGYGEREDDYWWFHGEIIVEVKSVIELTEYEYNLMSRLFSGHKQENYFEIVHAGYQSELEREEIQIHAGDNGNILLNKTDQGFVIDVYSQDEHINKIAVWEDKINGILLEVTNDFKNFSTSDIEDFMNEWGQTHVEICSNLEYDASDADDLLMIDYFWVQSNKKWYPKSASGYSKREQAIADHLRTNL